MEKKCDRFSPEDISRFADNELSPNRHREVTEHLHHCPVCSRVVEQYHTLATVFNDHAEKNRIKIDPNMLKHKFDRDVQTSPKPYGEIFT